VQRDIHLFNCVFSVTHILLEYGRSIGVIYCRIEVALPSFRHISVLNRPAQQALAAPSASLPPSGTFGGDAPANPPGLRPRPWEGTRTPAQNAGTGPSADTAGMR
jgi:hypothetical protein